MFSLVKCNCACCFEERDCVYCIHCAKAKTFYCKDCILEYNRINKTVGVCPTCRARYGKQNCYYIYGTDIVPVLSDQIDKYRERIHNSPELKLITLYDQLKCEQSNICSKRSMLLQLYLNRLYRDQHPMAIDIRSWCRGVHECESIMDMFDELCSDVSRFIGNHPNNILTNAICQINKRFNHIEWVYDGSRTEVTYIHNTYYRKIVNRHESVLNSYEYRNLTDNPATISITETPAMLSGEDRGFVLGSICAGTSLRHDNEFVDPLPTINDLPEPLRGICKIDSYELIKTLRNPRDETIINHSSGEHAGRYSVFMLKVERRPLKILPVIACLSKSLEFSDFDSEMRYYEAITEELKEFLNTEICYLRANREPIDNYYYRLMDSVLDVNNYVKRMLSRDEHSKVKARRVIEMLIDTVKREPFDVPSFMAQLEVYYMMAHPEDWYGDLTPIVNEISMAIFKDPSTMQSFERSVLQELRLAPSEDDDRYRRHVQLPETLSVSLANIIAKSNSTYKLSFVRCVCGGSVIAKPAETTGDKTIYECTRCHKQLDALPDQEIDEETAKLLESISKKCPVCGAFIQKAEGCNHMFCTNCKNGFNWNDLSKLDDRDNTNPHFQEHRHGSSSNLRTLLDDYDHSANREHEPIEWFGHVLFTEMNDAEKKLKDHRESIGGVYKEFLDDDRFALKFVNELNINKMHIAFVQNTFDRMMAKAFEAVQENERSYGSNRDLRIRHRRIINELSDEYSGGKRMIDAILEGLNMHIDCSMTIARNISHGIEEEEYNVPPEMEEEAKAMERDILKQIADRARTPIPEETIVIDGRRITVRRG